MTFKEKIKEILDRNTPLDQNNEQLVDQICALVESDVINPSINKDGIKVMETVQEKELKEKQRKIVND